MGRLEIGFKQFQDDISKALESLECRVDLKLSDIGRKIDSSELGQKES